MGDVRPRHSAELKDTIQTRKIAVLAADGFDDDALAAVKKALIGAGAMVKVVAPTLGTIAGSGGTKIQADFSLLTAASVLFDAVYVAGGKQSAATLADDADAVHFVNEAYKHCKATATTGAGRDLLRGSAVAATLDTGDDPGVVTGSDQQASRVAKAFIEAISRHRNWDRETKVAVPA